MVEPVLLSVNVTFTSGHYLKLLMLNKQQQELLVSGVPANEAYGYFLIMISEPGLKDIHLQNYYFVF